MGQKEKQTSSKIFFVACLIALFVYFSYPHRITQFTAIITLIVSAIYFSTTHLGQLYKAKINDKTLAKQTRFSLWMQWQKKYWFVDLVRILLFVAPLFVFVFGFAEWFYFFLTYSALSFFEGVFALFIISKRRKIFTEDPEYKELKGISSEGLAASFFYFEALFWIVLGVVFLFYYTYYF